MPTVEANPHTDPFAVLNAAQRAAVAHGADGDPRPLLVIAGAGTGKTLTLASRVAHLVLGGADLQRILLLTFSRRAASEMQQRVGHVLHRALGWGPLLPPPRLVWAGTFHSVGARLLRAHAPQLGLPETFTVQDRSDSEDLMGALRHALQFAETARRFPLKATCLAIYSRAVNRCAPLATVLAADFPWCSTWEQELKRLFRAYTLEKQNQHLLDCDDLLLCWSQMMQNPALAATVAARFDHVLVDEYQDTNRLQAAILHALKPDGRGLTVVGDDAQAIYGFRAAEVRNILDFPNRFTPPARVVTLERNYRSTQPLLDASNAVIALAAERHVKNLHGDGVAAERPRIVAVDDESAQAAWVAGDVLRQREAGIVLRQQAVLFRTSHHSAALEIELTRRGIPFVKFGGLKFLEAAHVKDLLSVLRWADNPRHRLAGLRVAQLVPGIGAASATRLLNAMLASSDPAGVLRAFRPPPAAAATWAHFAATFAALRAPERRWPADLDLALDWYLPQLRRLHADAWHREADLRQLALLAAGHRSRERFITELTLDPPDATSDLAGAPHRDDDHLVLSTLHSAKGQEWTAVTLLNVVDGCIPSDLATGDATQIEEERRLLYVGMTRAKHHLSLVVPQRFHVHQQAAHGDRHVYGTLSRFVPDQVSALFDLTGVSAASERLEPPGSGSDAAQGAVIDLGTKLQALWI